jgi:hypothetical protein
MAVTALRTRRSLQDRVSAEEWQIRVDLAAFYRLVAKHGLTDLTATHISARIPGPEHHFLLNPHGLLFSQVTASNLVKIDMDGVIYRGSEMIPGADRFVQALKDEQIPFLFLTNNSQRTRRDQPAQQRPAKSINAGCIAPQHFQ